MVIYAVWETTYSMKKLKLSLYNPFWPSFVHNKHSAMKHIKKLRYKLFDFFLFENLNQQLPDPDVGSHSVGKQTFFP